MGEHSITDALSAATLTASTSTEVTLARATVATRAHSTADCALLLDVLGLADTETHPRTRLRDLAWRPDHHLKRSSTAPAATAPDSTAVIASRAAAKRRRREAAKDHLRAQGLSGRELKSAMARLEGLTR